MNKSILSVIAGSILLGMSKKGNANESFDSMFEPGLFIPVSGEVEFDLQVMYFLEDNTERAVIKWLQTLERVLNGAGQELGEMDVSEIARLLESNKKYFNPEWDSPSMAYLLSTFVDQEDEKDFIREFYGGGGSWMNSWDARFFRGFNVYDVRLKRVGERNLDVKFLFSYMVDAEIIPAIIGDKHDGYYNYDQKHLWVRHRGGDMLDFAILKLNQNILHHLTTALENEMNEPDTRNYKSSYHVDVSKLKPSRLQKYIAMSQNKQTSIRRY